MKFSSLLPVIPCIPATPTSNFVQLLHRYIDRNQTSRSQAIRVKTGIVYAPLIMLRIIYIFLWRSLAILPLDYLMIAAFKTTRPLYSPVVSAPRLFYLIDDRTTYSRYQDNRLALKLQTPPIDVDCLFKNISTFFQIQKHGHETERKIIMQTGQ